MSKFNFQKKNRFKLMLKSPKYSRTFLVDFLNTRKLFFSNVQLKKNKNISILIEVG